MQSKAEQTNKSDRSLILKTAVQKNLNIAFGPLFLINELCQVTRFWTIQTSGYFRSFDGRSNEDPAVEEDVFDSLIDVIDSDMVAGVLRGLADTAERWHDEL